LALYVLPRLTASLAKLAPGVDLRFGPLVEDWPAALRRGDLDLKLGRTTVSDPALESQELSHEVYACVVRHGHAAPARPSLQQWAALRHLQIVPGQPHDSPDPATGAGGLVDGLLAQHGLTRRKVVSVSHFLVAPFVVASSDLVLTAPARLLERFIKPLQLRRIALPFELPSYALRQVWAKRTRDDEAQRWLRAQVASAFEKHGAHR